MVGRTQHRPLPSQEFLCSILRYEPATGKLYWKARPLEMFSGSRPEVMRKTWNTRYAGREAFTTKMKGGQMFGSINDVPTLAHRVIFKMVTGEEPASIDHHNGDGSDNRFENLRSVDFIETMHNMAMHKRNKSGQTGVFWYARKGLWSAYIRVNWKQIHLGYFERFEDAVVARKNAEVEHNFHPNHGRRTA